MVVSVFFSLVEDSCLDTENMVFSLGVKEAFYDSKIIPSPSSLVNTANGFRIFHG